MDTAALPSLTAWMDGVDQLSELLPLLPVLVSLELLLSADNAIALATIARGQKDPSLERRLNSASAWPLACGYIDSISSICSCFSAHSACCSLYLLWLCVRYLNLSDQSTDADQLPTMRNVALSEQCSPWQSLIWHFPSIALLQLSPSVIRSCSSLPGL